jgi:hypothetical protein
MSDKVSDQICFFCNKWTPWISDLGHCKEHHVPTLDNETCADWDKKEEAKA